MLNRETILEALVSCFKEDSKLHLLWEAGSAAFNRVDEWSDIDIGYIVDDDYTDDAFVKTREALLQLSPISNELVIPRPGTERQIFYKLQNASDFLLVDLSVFPVSNHDVTLEQEIHGKVKKLIERNNISDSFKFNEKEHLDKLEARKKFIEQAFDIFYILPLKELNRGNYVEAIVFYNNHMMRFLIDYIQILNNPMHFNFYSRYVHYELDAETVKRIEHLSYVSSPEDLRKKIPEAMEWFKVLSSGKH